MMIDAITEQTVSDAGMGLHVVGPAALRAQGDDGVGQAFADAPREEGASE